MKASSGMSEKTFRGAFVDKRKAFTLVNLAYIDARHITVLVSKRGIHAKTQVGIVEFRTFLSRQ